MMVVASFASSIRAQAGLPILCSGIILSLLKLRGWLQRFAVIALLVLAYVSISGLAVGTVKRHRDEVVGATFSGAYPGQHLFWHPAYLGLGYLPNRYGIRWDDRVAV